MMSPENVESLNFKQSKRIILKSIIIISPLKIPVPIYFASKRTSAKYNTQSKNN